MKHAKKHADDLIEMLATAIEAQSAPWQKPCPPWRVSVSRPITSHVVYNYLIYR